MSGLFGGDAPTPQPLPASPVDNGAAEQERLRAESEAIAAAKSRGRASTIVGGMAIAQTDQNSRAAARTLGTP